MVRTRSHAKSAASADPGGGGGRSGVKRKAKPAPAPKVAAPEAAAGESLVGNFGPEVDCDVLMVDGAAQEGAAVEAGMHAEGNVVVIGDATMVDAGTVGGVVEASDLQYEMESVGMIGMEGDGDFSCENIRVLNGDGRRGNTRLALGGLQSEVKAIVKAVELSNCFPAHHIEAEPNNSDQFTRYSFPHLGNGDFRVSDLVWSKLEGCSWWPGEIFDPSNASELALKQKIEGNYLVVYFGNNTFTWGDESQLMPLMANYAHMEKQCSSDEFINAVNLALEELSRRILSGMDCSCLSDELSDSGMSYLVDNQGLRDGVSCSTANKAEVLQYFHPENLLHYVKLLALFPGQGGDLLELVVACSQLTSFYRSKGCPELASFQTYNGWDDSAMDVSSTMNVTLKEHVTNVVHPDHDVPERGRGWPKQKPEEGIELTEKKEIHNLILSDTHDDFSESQNRKVGRLNSFEDSVTRSRSSFKIVECKHQAVTKLTGPSSVGMAKDDSRRDQRKKVHSPEVESTDHMQDSYWSGLTLQDGSVCSLEVTSSDTRPTRKRKSLQENFMPPSQHLRSATLAPKKQIQVMERPIVHGDAKIADQLKPTALVLRFGGSAALPSKMDLIKVFSRYGPLKETETEVHKDTNTAKVVFKKHLDAERGFIVTGKYGTFGPSLQSYRLVNMPFSLSA